MYDGYSSLRKRIFRTVTVSKLSSKDDLLLAAMKAFVVTQVRSVFKSTESKYQLIMIIFRIPAIFTYLTFMLTVMETGKRKYRSVKNRFLIYIRLSLGRLSIFVPSWPIGRYRCFITNDSPTTLAVSSE